MYNRIYVENTNHRNKQKTTHNLHEDVLRENQDLCCLLQHIQGSNRETGGPRMGKRGDIVHGGGKNILVRKENDCEWGCVIRARVL